MRACGSAKRFFGRAAGEKNRGDRSSLADAGGDDIRLDKLHGVVNRKARGDRAARRIDIELNVFFRIFGLQEEHLGGGQIGDVVVNRRADKDDVFFEEPGINVVSAFAAAGLFDHHRNERCAAILWFFEIFHLSKVVEPLVFLAFRTCHFDSAAATVLNLSILREPVESFVTPQLSFHPIERTLLCQTSANDFGGFATMAGHVFQLVIDFFVGHVDVFRGGDAVDDQFRLHVVGGAFLLALPQGNPIHVHGAGIDTLSGERANNAFQAHIHLMLDERFWYREVVQLHEFGQDFLAVKFLCAVIALMFQAFAIPSSFSSSSVAASLTSLANSSFSSGSFLFLMPRTSTA